MADDAQTREDDLRQLLTDAIEVQLAALKAGISFWTDWIEQTSEFVQTATKALSTIGQKDEKTQDVLLELVDAGRASIRSMTEIPRNTATRFIEELDKLHAPEVVKKPAAPTAATPKKKPAAARRRSGRVKT